MTRLLQRLRFWRDHRWTPGHLSAYVEGDLVTHAAARIQHHVRECPECREALRTLERMLGRLRRLAPLADAEQPDIATAVRRRMRDHTAG